MNCANSEHEFDNSRVLSIVEVTNARSANAASNWLDFGYGQVRVRICKRCGGVFVMESNKSISANEADRILIENNRMEMNMVDAEKLAAVNEITGKDYNRIDHDEQASA